MSEQKTVADIIAEMRDEGHTGESSCLEWVGAKMRYYADRIEAARKREKAAIEADALAVGGLVEASRKRELSKNTSKNRVDFEQLVDCAKMREALQQAKVAILAARKKMGVDNPIILEIIDAALAAPPRNCEVGTADEQAERFKFAKCDKLPKCRPWGECCLTCFAKWAQMPYEKGGTK